MEKKDITVIVPLHTFSEEIGIMLEDAINSVPKDIKVLVSTNEETKEAIKKTGKSYLYVTSVDTDFCSLVNNAVLNCETPYFSILEFDDIYSPYWFDEVVRYADFYQDVHMFMPMVDLLDDKQNKLVDIGNTAEWVATFTAKLGYSELEKMKIYFTYYPCGSVIETETFKNYGMFKPNVKITFWYEFMMRLLNSNKVIFTIPKIGYVHTVNRDGSLSSEQMKLSENELNYWIETAKNEYAYNKNRNIVYQYTEE
jgi:hypothetical protein